MIFALLATAPASADDEPPPQPGEFRLSISTEGYTYFNRPGADIAQHDEELKACLRESAKVRSPDEQIHSGGAGIIGSLLVAALSDGVRPAAVENCMIVRGWRVVALPEAKGKPLNDLPKEEISKALEPWVGAETPNGQIMRDGFHNEAITAKTKRFELRPPGEGRWRLSARSLGDFLDEEYQQKREEEKKRKAENKERKKRGEAPIEEEFDAPFERFEAKAIKKAEKVYAPPGMGLVIVNMKNLSQRNGIFLEFQRMDEATNTMAEGSRAEPNMLMPGSYLLGARKDANWRAFAVPPGRWRLATLNMVYEVVNLCMGSPAFEVREGDVIYAGTFDMGGDVLGPDLSMDPVKAWLNSQAGTEHVQPAVYSNGWTGECGGSSLYALEFADVPFREGYHWGSALVASAAAPASEPAPAEPASPEPAEPEPAGEPAESPAGDTPESTASPPEGEPAPPT